MSYTKIQEFLPAIRSLSPNKAIERGDLLSEQFLMERSGDLEMYYAPHNEFINREAIIVIVGITPGWNQMKSAFEQLLKGLNSHQITEQMLKQTKIAASFSGTMRTNLIDMLDQCDIPKAIGVNSSSLLFTEKRDLIHTTSVIKYPVFHRGKNYTGHQPSVDRSSLLRSYAYDVFPKELEKIEPSALVIPLGKTVEDVLFKLLSQEKFKKHTFLNGFPHPSGANGHRKSQFQEQKESLISMVRKWAESRHF